MNDFLQLVLDKRLAPTPSGEFVPVHSEISQAEGQLLQRLIRDIRPARSIEIGCSFGISTHYICEALREVSAKEHVIIDSGQRLGVKNVGLFNILQAGYGNLISLYNERSQTALPWFLDRKPRFDFALIDGAHTFDHTLVDFFFLDKIINIGGVIAFDDADWPGIRKVCKFVATNRHYEVLAYLGDESSADFFETESSMVAFVKRQEDYLPQTRDWSYFVDF